MYFLNHHQIFIFSLLLALLDNAYSASRINVEGTKFGEAEYINLFKIPIDYITSIESPGSTLWISSFLCPRTVLSANCPRKI